jgi:hypothetical protein
MEAIEILTPKGLSLDSPSLKDIFQCREIPDSLEHNEDDQKYCALEKAREKFKKEKETMALKRMNLCHDLDEIQSIIVELKKRRDEIADSEKNCETTIIALDKESNGDT